MQPALEVSSNQGLLEAVSWRHTVCNAGRSMKNVMEKLLALQNLQVQPSRPSAEVASQIDALRKEIPESLLGKFDRWMARRKKAVAVVHNGVCCECHIGVASGVVGALVFGDEVQHCGNCGRFLYLPSDEPVFSQKLVPEAKPARRRKKAPAHVI